MTAPVLSLCARLPLARFDLNVDLELGDGVTILFGPSGAGKTSLLETVAGLRPKSMARIELAGRLLEDSERKFRLPPQRRRVGYMPQDLLLFPHLNARQNILFGVSNLPPTGAPGFEEIVGLLELSPFLQELPSRLSGGERQRVALARALASGPDILLLDEPLSALDGGLKGKILPYLKKVRGRFRIPMLVVTHDLSDVFALGGEVLAMEKGGITHRGDAFSVLGRLASKPGWTKPPLENLLEGIVESRDPKRGLSGVRVGESLLWTLPMDLPAGSGVTLAVSAEDILVSNGPVQGLSARNVIPGKVEEVLHDGTDMLKIWAGFPLLVGLTRNAVEEMGLAPGTSVHLIIKSSSIRRV